MVSFQQFLDSIERQNRADVCRALDRRPRRRRRTRRAGRRLPRRVEQSEDIDQLPEGSSTESAALLGRALAVGAWLTMPGASFKEVVVENGVAQQPRLRITRKS